MRVAGEIRLFYSVLKAKSVVRYVCNQFTFPRLSLEGRTVEIPERDCPAPVNKSLLERCRFCDHAASAELSGYLLYSFT